MFTNEYKSSINPLESYDDKSLCRYSSKTLVNKFSIAGAPNSRGVEEIAKKLKVSFDL